MLTFAGMVLLAMVLVAFVAWGIVALTMRPWTAAISAQGKMLVEIAPLIIQLCKDSAILMRQSNPDLSNGDSDPMRKSHSSPAKIQTMADAVEDTNDAWT